jgi:hypothetical protein
MRTILDETDTSFRRVRQLELRERRLRFVDTNELLGFYYSSLDYKRIHLAM